MNCIFKKPDGKLCIFPALNNSEYCYLHDKNLVSLFFKKDCLPYKKDQFVFGLSREEGEKCFNNDAAVKIDRRLYKRFLMKQKMQSELMDANDPTLRNAEILRESVADAKNSKKSFNKGSALIKDALKK